LKSLQSHQDANQEAVQQIFKVKVADVTHTEFSGKDRDPPGSSRTIAVLKKATSATFTLKICARLP